MQNRGIGKTNIPLTFHSPVVDGGVCDEADDVDADPLPERHLVGQSVCLHLALHLDVEDLQGLPSWNTILSTSANMCQTWQQTIVVSVASE